MFDFLNKLTHNHQTVPPSPSLPPPEEQNSLLNSSQASEDEQSQQLAQQSELHTILLPKRPQLPKPKEEKKVKKIVSVVGKMQQNAKFELDEQAAAILKSTLRGSEMGISGLLLGNVAKIKQAIEKKVYIRQMSRCEQEYLQEANNLTKINNYFVNQQISSTIHSVIDQIANDIQTNQIQPRLKRKRFLDNGEEKKIEALKLIRMQESQLQQKIGELRVELKEDNLLDRRAKEIIDKDQYSTENIKTKMAEEFVKELQKEKEEQKAKKQELKQKKKEIQIQTRVEQELQAQKAKQQRHLMLLEQFLEKQKAKKEKEEQERAQQLNFQSFMKEYKAYKPLYKKKEEQFQEAIKKEKKERYQILKEKQSKYESLNIESLDMHEEKYLQLQRQDRERKQAQISLAKHEENLRKKQLSDKVYKGRFRYLILQEMVEEEVKKKQKQDEKKAILAKKQAYSMEIKERFRPTVDPAKKRQLEELVNSQKAKRRKYMSPNRVAYSERHSTIGSRPSYSETATEPDPKQEGKRYHRLFKQYIKDKIDRGEIRQTTEKPVQVGQSRPDYLKELREKFSDRIPSRSARLDRQIQKLQGGDYRVLLLRAQDFENKAKQREQKIRNAPHKPEEEARLEEDYLCAIKAKMKLINNID